MEPLQGSGYQYLKYYFYNNATSTKLFSKIILPKVIGF